eukprot:12225584-Alexandrium_andersonii.AAC.1
MLPPAGRTGRAAAAAAGAGTWPTLIGRHRRVHSGGSIALPGLPAGSSSFELLRAKSCAPFRSCLLYTSDAADDM